VALLLLLGLPAWSRLGLVAWGNHYEAGCMVLAGWALAARSTTPRAWLATGLCLGLGLTVGWSAAPGLLGMLAWLLLRRELRGLAATLLGSLLGFAPALLRQALLGEGPFSTIYEPGEALPRLARLPAKLLTLLPPNQLAGLLGVRQPVAGPILGLLALASLGAALVLLLRRRGHAARAGQLAATLLVAWLGVYLGVRFQVERPGGPLIPTAEAVRYAAPAMPLAAVMVAMAAALRWQEGRRLWALALVLPWLLAGTGARLAALARPFPRLGALHMAAGDLDFFREQASWALPEARQRVALAQASPRLQPVFAYALGRRALLAALPDPARPPAPLPTLSPEPGLPARAWAEGVGAAALDGLDPQAGGSADVMGRALDRVEALADQADWPAELRQAALRAAAWRRVDGGAPDALFTPLAHDETLLRLAPAIERLALPSSSRDALWWAAGRRWARDRAPLWQPSELAPPLPVLPPQARLPFCEGLGEAEGEAWGPDAAAALPAGLSPAAEAARAQGVATGAARRWRSTDLTGEDVAR